MVELVEFKKKLSRVVQFFHLLQEVLVSGGMGCPRATDGWPVQVSSTHQVSDAHPLSRENGQTKIATSAHRRRPPETNLDNEKVRTTTSA